MSAQLMAVGVDLAAWLDGLPLLSCSFGEAVTVCSPH